MADFFKISEFTELTTATDDDLLVMVDQPGSSGFGETKKISRLNLVKALATKDDLAGRANTGHTHDDRYYTETEADTLLAGKSAASQTHTPSQVGLSNVPNTDATVRGNHTGTQSADTIVDGMTNHSFT